MAREHPIPRVIDIRRPVEAQRPIRDRSTRVIFYLKTALQAIAAALHPLAVKAECHLEARGADGIAERFIIMIIETAGLLQLLHHQATTKVTAFIPLEFKIGVRRVDTSNGLGYTINQAIARGTSIHPQRPSPATVAEATAIKLNRSIHIDIAGTAARHGNTVLQFTSPAAHNGDVFTSRNRNICNGFAAAKIIIAAVRSRHMPTHG